MSSWVAQNRSAVSRKSGQCSRDPFCIIPECYGQLIGIARQNPGRELLSATLDVVMGSPAWVHGLQCNTNPAKKTRATFLMQVRLKYQVAMIGRRRAQVSNNAFGSLALCAAARGQQVVCLLLSTVPLAERMLLYHAVTVAWVMLPEPGQLGKCIRSYYGRLGLSRHTSYAQG
jgi:hypothetical protein